MEKQAANAGDKTGIEFKVRPMGAPQLQSLEPARAYEHHNPREFEDRRNYPGHEARTAQRHEPYHTAPPTARQAPRYPDMRRAPPGRGYDAPPGPHRTGSSPHYGSDRAAVGREPHGRQGIQRSGWGPGPPFGSPGMGPPPRAGMPPPGMP
eukprot:CAMPEP_0114626596 /NCGR_PEP_ID=MMETSP0168-20121206/11863_1 /TAXON_ID=95228 ORGANISM="Vannella sp., Strain DIVA3 517/6/12" /NCGR_SAMPLE_ID=MMETSP0168 /ASSEMBLY_ACC=CAM_ASM_000044 /LENGTH=150 /DNA_ID=CAMNT_0001837905 /DNA_START=62 /DNA_END=511 /DNA_ORIENTATION=-